MDVTNILLQTSNNQIILMKAADIMLGLLEQKLPNNQRCDTSGDIGRTNIITDEQRISIIRKAQVSVASNS